MGKISLVGVALAYIRTLKSYKKNRYMLSDIIVQLVMPAVAGILFALFWPLSASRLSALSGNVVSCVSIVSALLCGVAVMVFQLRMQMSAQSDPKPTRRERTLVDETFHDILWAVVAGFASVALIVIAEMMADECAPQKIVYGVSVFFLLNFILVTCMCIKRLHSAYQVISEGWQK